ncbi:MAG TPA: hypothetical protein VF572_06100 [Candidatus Saccharimonadales bacterium]|jgi:cytoskeletal protein RodZ
MYKQKQTAKRPLKTPVIIGVVIGILLLGGLLYFLNISRNNAASSKSQSGTSAPETINLNEATEEEKKASEQVKLGDDKTAPAPAPNPVPADTQVTISSLTQNATSKDIVVQTKLLGTGWQDCTLTFTQNGQTVTKQAGVLFQSEFSTCKGFAVKASELPAAGQWAVNLSVSKSDGTSATDEDNISIVK